MNVALGFISERAGVSVETLYSWYENPERAGALRFDVADRLLCAADRWTMWRGELYEYYMRVDLAWKQCECPGCETDFRLKKDTWGRDVLQKYCSRQCAQSAYKIRSGRNQQRLAKSNRRKKGGRPVGVIDRKCRHNHPLTPDNLMRLSNGKWRCRVCHRESSARAYAAKRKRAQVAA